MQFKVGDKVSLRPYEELRKAWDAQGRLEDFADIYNDYSSAYRYQDIPKTFEITRIDPDTFDEFSIKGLNDLSFAEWELTIAKLQLKDIYGNY